ncbi:hypothetical protein BWI17_02025 [Betaproteobacteria bacterium GR16-43]|nr:hypothetical protein BWI17_02025 [Betaproteobacteria bacterium GR16-43]
MKTIRWFLALALFSCSTAWADGWVRCADDGGTCKFDGSRKVQYGEGGKWVVRQYDGTAACNKGAFGGTDPSPGKKKHCRFQSSAQAIGYLPAPPQWANCAAEGAMCRFTGAKKVAYGTGSSWRMDSFVGAIECSNAVFGDPAPGKRKECRYLK